MTKKKKILLGIGLLAVAVVTIPLFAAFEAHVINVTAKIENALSVNTNPINFGTVFPQEELDATVDIALSESFLAEDNADDVEYVIRQKPKCGWTTHEGQELIGETQSGHIDDKGNITCPSPLPLPTSSPTFGLSAELVNNNDIPVWGPLPLLCRYLSKHDLDPEDQNDEELDAFHEIGEIVNNVWVWNDVKGRLAKSQNDSADGWNIDLKVPCFGGHCAQDWDAYVKGINPTATSTDYIQPIENEHKIFGCDLWIEVTGVSRVEQPNGNTASISLENKDANNNWIVENDETHGTLVYGLSGSTFAYTLTAQGLQANTNYSLIYYADPWPGNHPGAFIGSGTTDGTGNINFAGNPDLGMDLPTLPDTNYPTGAKIWLVPSSDHNGVNSMTAWNPTLYLYEYNVIQYDDTDIP